MSFPLAPYQKRYRACPVPEAVQGLPLHRLVRGLSGILLNKKDCGQAAMTAIKKNVALLMTVSVTTF